MKIVVLFSFLSILSPNLNAEVRLEHVSLVPILRELNLKSAEKPPSSLFAKPKPSKSPLDLVATVADGKWLAFTVLPEFAPDNKLRKRVILANLNTTQPRVHRQLGAPESWPNATPKEIKIIRGRFLRILWESEQFGPFKIKNYEFFDIATDQRFTLNQSLNISDLSSAKAFSDLMYVVRVVSGEDMNYQAVRFDPAIQVSKGLGEISFPALGESLIDSDFHNGSNSNHIHRFFQLGADLAQIHTRMRVGLETTAPRYQNVVVSLANTGVRVFDDTSYPTPLENGKGLPVPGRLEQFDRIARVGRGFVGIRSNEKFGGLELHLLDENKLKPVNISHLKNIAMTQAEVSEDVIAGVGHLKTQPSELRLLRVMLNEDPTVPVLASATAPRSESRRAPQLVLKLEGGLEVIKVNDHMLGIFDPFLDELLKTIPLASPNFALRQSKQNLLIDYGKAGKDYVPLPAINEVFEKAVTCDQIVSVQLKN